MGICEFMMLCCFGFSWPFSIIKSIRTKSAKGKSLGFMVLIELGYVFGIAHKILFDCNWVLGAYVALFVIVAIDILLYFRYSAADRRRENG